MASEPSNDMTMCEQMQVAHEMWAHGAQASIDASDVERHASGCDVCGPYVAQSRKIDTMTAFAIPTLNFSQLRDRVVAEVPKAKRVLYLLIALYAAAMIYGATQGKSSTVIVMGVLGMYAYRKAAKRVSALVGAAALAQADQLAAWRTDVADQLREHDQLLPWMPVIFAVSIAFAYAGHIDALIIAVLMIPLFVTMVVSRKKLRAELASWR
jgi:hypothetical protein